jgi:hypothetical protein
MVGGAVAHSAATPELCCRYLQVTIPDSTDRIIAQARALVRAIEALGTIEPSGASSARTLWHYESKRTDSDVAGFRNKSTVKTQPNRYAQTEDNSTQVK